MKITIYTDPGHGWAAIKKAKLVEFGIEHKISSYSYERGQTAYLEEDCDLSILIGELKVRGIMPAFVEKHTDRRSPIRSYATYKKPVDRAVGG